MNVKEYDPEPTTTRVGVTVLESSRTSMLALESNACPPSSIDCAPAAGIDTVAVTPTGTLTLSWILPPLLAQSTVRFPKGVNVHARAEVRCAVKRGAILTCSKAVADDLIPAICL